MFQNPSSNVTCQLKFQIGLLNFRSQNMLINLKCEKGAKLKLQNFNLKMACQFETCI